MRRLYRFARLPRADQRLLIKSVWLLCGMRIGLWLLPLRTLRRLSTRLPRSTPASRPGDDGAIDRVAWAVAAASRLVPGTTCLGRALGSQILLAERGVQADLHIGVARDQHGFRAHAWVKSGDRIVGGTPEGIEQFTSLPPLEGEPQ